MFSCWLSLMLRRWTRVLARCLSQSVSHSPALLVLCVENGFPLVLLTYLGIRECLLSSRFLQNVDLKFHHRFIPGMLVLQPSGDGSSHFWPVCHHSGVWGRYRDSSDLLWPVSCSAGWRVKTSYLWLAQSQWWNSNNIGIVVTSSLGNYLGVEPDRKLTKGKVYTVKVMLDAIGKINYWAYQSLHVAKVTLYLLVRLFSFWCLLVAFQPPGHLHCRQSSLLDQALWHCPLRLLRRQRKIISLFKLSPD